jgi:hypothetical protein
MRSNRLAPHAYPSRSSTAVGTAGQSHPFWKQGVWCVRLNQEPSARLIQPIAVGIDPGSKKEALIVRSAAHTYLNLQADAVTWVKHAVKTRRTMRRARRFRKTPCRQPRANRLRTRKWMPPSTKARGPRKQRLCQWLIRLYPIAAFMVEDIKAVTKGKQRWDRSFSPLEVGKRWFYQELGRLAPVQTRQGWETKQLRDTLGLVKSKAKMVELFSAHCVDAWVLAHAIVGGTTTPENARLLCVPPFQWHRRQLHRLQPEKGGKRKPYGGTRSGGFTRGTLVQHPKYGLVYVGGTLEGRVSLHHVLSGKRLCQNAKPTECRVRTLLKWRARLLPVP